MESSAAEPNARAKIMIFEFLIDRILAFVTLLDSIATTCIVFIIKNIPIVILLTTIVCLAAVVFAAFEAFYFRASLDGKAVRYRPGKIAVRLTVLGAVAGAVVGIGWQAGWADAAPVLDFFGTQFTATALLVMLSASVFDVGSVLLLTSEVRESARSPD